MLRPSPNHGTQRLPNDEMIKEDLDVSARHLQVVKSKQLRGQFIDQSRFALAVSLESFQFALIHNVSRYGMRSEAFVFNWFFWSIVCIAIKHNT